MARCGRGQEFEFGMIPATTWHTAIALAASTKILPNELPNLVRGNELTEEESLGQAFAQIKNTGRITQEVAFGGVQRYQNADWTHFFQLVGEETKGGADPYTHQADVDECPLAFYTMAGALRDSTAGSSELFEYPSIKPSGFEITTGDDGFMNFAYTGMADTLLTTNDADIVNTTTTTLTTSTVNSYSNIINFGQCRVNLNDQDGADFNASGEGTDRVFPSGVSISMNRDVVADYDANRLAADTGDADTYKTNAPNENSRPEILVTLDFPEFDDINYVEEYKSNQAKKMEIYFYNVAGLQLKFSFPNVYYESIDAQPSGLGLVPQTLTYRALAVSAAPTGMTGITAPFRVILTNGWSKNYVTNAA